MYIILLSFDLSYEERWDIDKKLGILDWQGLGIMTKKDKKRFKDHYK